MAEALDLLLEQAEQARDAALQALQQAQQRAAQARAQVKDLGDYQSQYDQRWINQFREQGAAMPIVQAHQGFGQRLQEAIGHQAQLAGVLEARVEAARQLLQERELKVASVRKLIERRAAERLAKQLRNEQKALDEFGAQRHQRQQQQQQQQTLSGADRRD